MDSCSACLVCAVPEPALARSLCPGVCMRSHHFLLFSVTLSSTVLCVLHLACCLCRCCGLLRALATRTRR
jgi:hypothetical protein